MIQQLATRMDSFDLKQPRQHQWGPIEPHQQS